MLLPPEITEQIPPSARYCRVPLTEDDNGYGIWQEAAQKYVPHEASLTPYFWSNTKVFPRGKLGGRVRAWLDANEESLRMYRAGTRRKGWQLPEFTVHDDFVEAAKLDRIEELRSLAFVLQAHVRRCLAEGQIEEATQAAIDQMRAGRMVCCGDGIILHFLVGVALFGLGQECAREVAVHRLCPAPCIEKLTSAVDELIASDDGYAKSCRVELVYQLVELLSVPDVADGAILADHLISQTYSSDVEWVFDEDEKAKLQQVVQADRRLELRDNDIRYLLRGHPEPFDCCATARMFAESVDRVIQGYSQGWQCSKNLANHAASPLGEIWPIQLQAGFPVQYLGTSQQARTTCAEEYACHYGKELPYPDADALEVARARMKEVSNPVGWMIWVRSHGISTAHSIFLSRAHLLALRVTLALAVYRRRHRRMPSDLESVVQEGLLDMVPIDPFDDQPLRYCPRRQIVWSVGQNGIDDNGDAGRDWDGFLALDLVVSARTPSRWDDWREYWAQWRAMRKSLDEIV